MAVSPSSHGTSSATASPRAGIPPEELYRKAAARLLERIDPARSRHKPFSLVRQEAKRILDQYLDQEFVLLNRENRERLIEDVIAASPGVSVLEEHFRDDGVQEIQIFAAHLILCLKGDVWLPSPARYRDEAQLLTVIERYAEIGVPLSPPGFAAGYDVRLPNGFRVLAILPPEGLNLPPTVALIRSAGAPTGSGTMAAWNGSKRSGAVSHPAPPSEFPSSSPNAVTVFAPRSPASVSSDTFPGNARRKPPTDAVEPDPFSDPHAKLRQRVIEWIIMKFAGAGIYDLSQIPVQELRRIISTAVIEILDLDRLRLDENTRDRITLEILATMNR